MSGSFDAQPSVERSGPPEMHVQTHQEEIRLVLSGAWRLARRPPTRDDAERMLSGLPAAQRLVVNVAAVTDWDSSLVVFLRSLQAVDRGVRLRLEVRGVTPALERLLGLARSMPTDHRGSTRSRPASFVTAIGQDFLDLARSTGEILAFFGEGTLALRRLLMRRARFRQRDLWLTVQQSGADALPIVSLISFLVGVILGYIADQQLALFGARVYVADMVGLAMVIQMGALITAIVLAGRTGAAFAAELGSMQVNEEIDALRTLGVAPMEFLVLPRMLALTAMTPLLTVYADLLGILGGAFVGVAVGGLSLTEYLVETRAAIEWGHILQGLISATVYGAIVAASGCLRGMQSGRSAAAVGEATTSAVVTAIVFIVIAAAVLTILFDAVGLS
jgi:phospholipid/cholesterol/gamma-HCH transport system permease protein